MRSGTVLAENIEEPRDHDVAQSIEARFHYERALGALFALNPQDVKEKIEEWPVDDSLPFWEAKRAGLLAEIGQLRDAARILESSLAAIRS